MLSKEKFVVKLNISCLRFVFSCEVMVVLALVGGWCKSGVLVTRGGRPRMAGPGCPLPTAIHSPTNYVG